MDSKKFETHVSRVNTKDHVNDPVDWFPINQLPNELLILIFSFLPIEDSYYNVSQVCNIWHKLVADSWKLLNFSKFKISDEDIIKIVKRARLLHTIVLYNRKQVDNILCEVSLNCSNVKTIVLINCSVSEDSLMRLAENCSSVSHIDLLFSELNISSGSNVLSKFKNLSHLDLIDCKGFDDGQLISIGENCHKLYRLNINRIFEVTDRGMAEFLSSRCESIGDLLIDCEKLTDKSLCLLYLCQSLQNLEITCAWHMTDVSLKSLTKINLSSLGLESGHKLTSLGLNELFKSRTLSQLTTLQLHNCLQVDDKVLKEVSKTCYLLSHLEINFCKQITDMGVRNIVHSCSSLTALILNKLILLKGNFLVDIPNKLFNLHNLDLSGCSNIDRNLLYDISDKMPWLEIIDHMSRLISAHSSSDCYDAV